MKTLSQGSLADECNAARKERQTRRYNQFLALIDLFDSGWGLQEVIVEVAIGRRCSDDEARKWIKDLLDAFADGAPDSTGSAKEACNLLAEYF